jgi:LemA protein
LASVGGDRQGAAVSGEYDTRPRQPVVRGGHPVIWFFLILLLLLLGVVGWVVGGYNRLVRSRVRIDEAWAQIDTQLQRRHDLIPNLVNTVKGYASHERETFEEVTAARAKAISVQGPADLAEAENGLTQALGKLLAITENYPELKADANFRQLQEELAHTENMVAGSRGHYNASVRDYDTARKVFPTSIIAGIFNFEDREYFEVDTVEVRQAPNVSFE